LALTTKTELDKLIEQGDPDALLEALRTPGKGSKLIRRITAGLCSTEPRRKWQAVSAMGVVAGKGGLSTDKVADRITRFLWALNDESGDVPYGIPEALGEILTVRPELRARCIPILVSFLVQEELFQTGPILAGAIWALGHAGVSDQEERDRARPGLRLALAAADSGVRGAALWTAARLGLAASLQQEIRGLAGDDSGVCLLIDGAVQELKIGDLADQVLSGLTTTIQSP
jgi:hypothetical protein